MAYQPVDIGSAPNDGTGDPIRDAFDKVNDNFVELYAGLTGLLDFKGSTDCSANPNYPAASKGDFYVVSVAGKIGGASGTDVEVGDAYFAEADNAGGTQAAVGTDWSVIQGNIVGSTIAELDDIPDVNAPTPANGDVLTWDSTPGEWVAAAPTGGSFTAASPTEVLTGTDNSKGVTPDSLAALWEQGSDVASAGTVSLGEGGYFNITGTTTITDIDFATDKAGRKAWVKFAGALTLTHNASTLILPTGANITTAAGDAACFISEGSDVVRCVSYQRASGAALSSSGSSGVTIIRLIQGTGSLTSINVNSTSYVAVGLYFTVNIDSFPFTQYQIIGQGQSNAAGQTVSLQLATFGTPTTPIHTGGDDITGIPNTGGSPIRTSGWLTRDDGVTTGYKEYAVVAKGSNSTVDIQFNYLDIWLK